MRTYVPRFPELKIRLWPEIDPVTIELSTPNNKNERITTDRAVAHKAVDMFFDFHEAEYNAKWGDIIAKFTKKQGDTQ